MATKTWIRNWFSNFTPLDRPLVEEGIEYPTVENYYQAMKCERLDDRRELSDCAPAIAKKRVRGMELRKDWEKDKLKVMEKALRHKFERGTSWEKKLRESVGPIVEWNNWGDEYWGIDADSKKGENHLGKLLMTIRADNAARYTEPAIVVEKEGPDPLGFRHICVRCGRGAVDTYGPYKLCKPCIDNAQKLMQAYVEQKLDADDLIAGHYKAEQY